MSSNKHTDEIYKEKRVPKGPIKYQVSLNEEQKIGKEIILNNDVVVVRGKAGSGKTLLAAQVALDCLLKKQFEKIIIARPVVTAAEDIGFLPGSAEMKLAPFTAPVYENMYRLKPKAEIDKLVSDGKIQVIPIAFLRGYNFTDSIVIIDEAQNATGTQLELILSRICFGSKVIVCGDIHQIDLRKKSDSGFEFLYKSMKGISGFAEVNLLTNHRHPIVEEILKVYSTYRD